MSLLLDCLFQKHIWDHWLLRAKKKGMSANKNIMSPILCSYIQ